MIIKVFLHLFFALSLLYLGGVEGTCVNVNPTDVVFVVDTSGSICDSDPGYVYLRDKTCNNWKSILNFMAGIVNQLQIGPTAVMVGLVTFQNNAKVAWTLDRYPTKAELINAINNVAYIGGDTSTTLGLRAMRTQVFGTSGDRPNAVNVAIIVTDGNPTFQVEELPYEIQMVQGQGITMVAVGITNAINENVLRSLSSPPQMLNVNYFISPDYQSVSSISQRLEIYTFCPSEAPQLPETTANPCVNTPLYSDIVFVVDGSGSICDTDPNFKYGTHSTCNNWALVINFMKNLVTDLAIGPTYNRIAVVVFYSYAYVAFNLDRYNDKSSILYALDQLRYDPGGDTATTDGLYKMRTEVFGGPGNRPDYYNMAIIITDGRPTIRVSDLQAEINAVQAAGIAMVAIGVTNSIDQETLKKLSSPPQILNQNYFMSADFNSIIIIKSSLQNQVLCPSTTPAGKVVSDEPCKTTSTFADVTFVVDTSGSICDTDPGYMFGRDMNCNNFDKLKNFLKDIVRSLNIGPNANRVALVTFRSVATVLWTLDRYWDSNSLVYAIDQMRYDPGGDTATTDGLLKMRTEVFGQYGDRPEMGNVAIIITDGRPTIRVLDLQDEVTRCQQAGINMVAIGVTNSIDEMTLRKLSSPPQLNNSNYFMTADYNSINTIKSRLETQILCPSTTTPGPILAPTTTPRRVCTSVDRLDVVFVIDNSGSICDSDPHYVYPRDKTCNNWQLILNFMRDLVNVLPISSADVRVGLVTFHSYAVVHWTLDRYPDKYSLLNAINQVQYVGGDTATADGLNKMRTQVFSQAGDRPDVNNVAIVLTDGRPTVGVNNLSNEEYLNQLANINVVAIGVTNDIDEYTLSMISSSPHQLNTNYFRSPDFAGINLIREKLERATFCPNQ